FRSMEERLLEQAGIEADAVEIIRSFDGRLLGQSWETPFVEVPPGPITPAAVGTLIEQFHNAYEARNGTPFDVLPVQAVTYPVRVVVPSEKVVYPRLDRRAGAALEPDERVALHYLGDGDVEAAAFERATLMAGDEIVGPAVIREEMSTTFVPLGRV